MGAQGQYATIAYIRAYQQVLPWGQTGLGAGRGTQSLCSACRTGTGWSTWRSAAQIHQAALPFEGTPASTTHSMAGSRYVIGACNKRAQRTHSVVYVRMHVRARGVCTYAGAQSVTHAVTAHQCKAPHTFGASCKNKHALPLVQAYPNLHGTVGCANTHPGFVHDGKYLQRTREGSVGAASAGGDQNPPRGECTACCCWACTDALHAAK
jgi:hypothetical protein